MKKPLVVAIIFLMEKIKTFFIKNNYLIPILFLIFGLGVFFYPMFLNFDKMPGDLGDARFINFILEHYYQYINNNPIHDRFWVLPMHHPLKNTLAYSDLLLGSSFLYIPFRYIFNAQTTFQIFLLLVCFLNYFSFYFLSKKIFKFSTFFASFASFIFCFSLPRHAQTYHLQLFVQFFMILSILSFALISKENSKLKNKILFSFGLLFFVLQFYSAYYFAWFMVFSIPILLISFLSTKRTRVILKNWLKCFDFSYVPIILAFFVIIWLNNKVMPIYMNYSESEMKRLVTTVINKSVGEELTNQFDTNELFIIKTSNEKITMVDFDPVIVNRVMSSVRNIVYDNLKLISEKNKETLEKFNVSESIFYIPTGVIFDSVLLTLLNS